MRYPKEKARLAMKAGWNKRAQENIFHYISTFRKDWSQEEFFNWGKEQTEAVVFNFCQELNIESSQMILLEIGSGVGRMTRFLAQKFKYIYAYDVSHEMVNQAKRLNPCLNNVTFISNDGESFPEIHDHTINYVFSGWTLQHAPTHHVVENNVKEISRVLSQHGIYQLNVGLWKGHLKLGRFTISHNLLRYLPTRLLDIYRSLSIKDRLITDPSFRGIKFTIKQFSDLLKSYDLRVDIKTITYYNSFRDQNETDYWFYGGIANSAKAREKN